MSEKYVCLSEFSLQQFERKRMKINFGFKNPKYECLDSKKNVSWIGRKCPAFRSYGHGE